MKSAVDQLVGASPRAVPDMIFENPVLQSSSAPSLSGFSATERTPRRVRREPLIPNRLRRLRVAHLLVPVSLGLLLFVAACAAFPALIAPYLPTDMHNDAILSAPRGAHWFGTDQFGRDVFSLVVYGARQSVLIGIFAVLISCSIGVSIGLTAGYAGGWLDTALMRFIDVWMAIPNILLAIALSTVLGPSLVNTIFAISITTIPRYARILRGQALSVRSRPFIEASRAAGASHFSILRRHVLPHCSVQIMVLATLGVGSSILIGSGLSFLGLGVNDERPDWGFLLTQGRSYLTVAWWTVTFPGLAITSLVVSVNLLGDALRRRFDPRSAPR
ncbi:MAG TPA: ABC transporter permease [Polyangiaceae bacterium]|nr:ABC transporter permease [Polyangiaceae bacterium]